LAALELARLKLLAVVPEKAAVRQPYRVARRSNLDKAMNRTIAVEDLRVGMYIMLEGGWLAHPFPLSNFRLTTREQVAAVRGLGVSHVRWLPERSELDGPEPLQSPDQAQEAGSERTVAVATTPSSAAVASTSHSAPSSSPTPDASHGNLLHMQREAALRCEQQHEEAAEVLRGLLNQAQQEPVQAGQTARRLTQAMLDKMLLTPEVGIRLVNTGADRDSAHALNVCVISLLVGRALGLQAEDLHDLGVGAMLHDIGKAAVPTRCQHMHDSFSVSDAQQYQSHVSLGVQQGQRMALSEGALVVLAQHHERADGQGFPARLTKDRISLAARLVAIVDRYDNLCNPQSRELPVTPHEAVSILFAQSTQRFDGAVLNAFIRMMGVYPAGSLVQLTDDRFAMVVGANSSRPLKPQVLIHDPAVPREQATLFDLQQTPNLGIRRSLTANRVPAASLRYLDPRARVAYYFEPLPHAMAQPQERREREGLAA
jgi:HD-GYP domain-containing protein (c-di-GMP phosphodiesterase class II)